MKKNITVLGAVMVGAFALIVAVQAHALSLYGSAGGGVQGNTASTSATTTVDVNVSGTASGSVSAAAQLLVSEPMPIMSPADLDTYDDIVIKARPAVAAINVDNTNNTIAIQYSQPAKLFGVFSTSITSNVMVDAQGNASVQLPWWSVFYTKNTAAVQTSVSGAILQSGASFDAQADASTRLQNEARVIDAVTGALQAQAVAEASTSASTSASTE